MAVKPLFDNEIKQWTNLAIKDWMYEFRDNIYRYEGELLDRIASKVNSIIIITTTTQMEGGRKWEELDMDCLANVFGRVGIESLLLDVPFVCKSWYKATLNPKCWEQLVFPKIFDPDPWSDDDDDDPFVSRLMDEYKVRGYFSITALVNSVLKRSCRSATLVSLPSCATEEELACVADECPTLKILLLPYGIPTDDTCESIIPSLVNKWTHLEILRLGSSFNIQEILAQISIHCKNFVGLAVTRTDIEKDQASAIVALVPNIRYLFLRGASIERENLLTILKGCKELVELDVRNCIGFKGDDEIIKLASNIRKFMYEGSCMRYDSEEDMDMDAIIRDYRYHDNCTSD